MCGGEKQQQQHHRRHIRLMQRWLMKDVCRIVIRARRSPLFIYTDGITNHTVMRLRRLVPRLRRPIASISTPRLWDTVVTVRESLGERRVGTQFWSRARDYEPAVLCTTATFMPFVLPLKFTACSEKNFRNSYSLCNHHFARISFELINAYHTVLPCAPRRCLCISLNRVNKIIIRNAFAVKIYT